MPAITLKTRKYRHIIKGTVIADIIRTVLKFDTK